LTVPDVVLPSTTTNPVTISLAGANIPLGTVVAIKVLGLNGGSATATSTALSGTLASSTATASVTIPTDQPSTISATATYTLTASVGGGPVFVQGDEIDQVVVSTTAGGQSRVAYVTKSGRQRAVDPIR